MKYKKTEMYSYNIHTINTDKFKTVTIKINFKKQLEKIDITYRNLLIKVLLQSSKKYPTNRLLNIKCEQLYNISIDASNNLSGNYIVTSFNNTFLNDKYTETNLNNESIDFIIDVIFNPNIKNGCFDEDSFKIAKKLLIDQIKSLKDEPNAYSVTRLLEELDPNTNLSYRACGYLEDLEQIDSKKLYDYYIKMFKSDVVDIFIIGDIDEQQIIKAVKEHFFVKTIKKPTKSHYIEHKSYRKKSKQIKETISNNQSVVVLGYKLDKLSSFERNYVLPVYSYILGGGADSKLFKVVREEHSLCYSISATVRLVSNIMLVISGINATDYTKCVSLVKKETKKIGSGKVETDDLEKAIITYQNAYREVEDSPMSILNIYVSHEYLKTDLLEERMKNISLVTKEMVVNISKKIHLDTIYLLEGEITNEN